MDQSDIVFSQTQAQETKMAEAGNRAPSFSVPNQDGVTVSLESLAGKRVLIWFYPKADTRGWTIEGNGFRDRIQDFQSKNVTILGVSFDSSQDQKAFKDKFDFPYDLLADTDKSMSIAYGAADASSEKPRRISVLIDTDGNIERVFDPVVPAEHPDEVLAVL